MNRLDNDHVIAITVSLAIARKTTTDLKERKMLADLIRRIGACKSLMIVE